MYADKVTDSMQRAIYDHQRAPGPPGGLQPRARDRPADDPQGGDATSWPASAAPSGRPYRVATGAAGRRDRSRSDYLELPHDELGRLIQTLEEEMHQAAADLRFEYAARLRDEVADLRRELREVG